ncbi:SMR family transporter [Stenotrophomonas sp. YIM B06876]|uniref:SMR family transporter n=1 Tax=Stenotrophomonas sp. YIM B06876 TaxID=3060211 RepID=UPI00273914F5|nr:SMR family transporter [Stenotrophomonas sp. YIM B06876]
MNVYWILGAAIVAEVVATTALKASAGFTRLWPSFMVVLGYGVAFYCLSLTLKTMPMGVAYAIWSGLGIVLIAVAGYLLFGQRIDLAALLGMALIVAGVAVIQLFSKTAAH